MKKYLIILLFLVIIFQPALWPQEGKTLGLVHLVHSLLDHNMDIQAQAGKTSVQLEKVNKAAAARLPGASITGIYTRIGVIPRFEIPGMGDFEFVSPNMINISLGIDYTLFDWGMSRDQIQVEKLGLKSQKLNTLLLKKGLILQLSTLYYNTLQARESIQVLGENITILEEILTLLKRQFQAGLIPEHQILQTQSLLESLKAQQLEIQGLKDDLKVTIKNICGLPAQQAIQLAPLAPMGPGKSPQPDSLLETARSEREEFQLLSTQLGILEKTKHIIARTGLPLVSAGLNAELKNGIMPEVDKLKTNWNIGLTVIYNIFDRNASKFERKALDHQIHVLRISREKLTRDVGSNLERLCRGAEILARRLEIESRRLEISKKSLELARRSFNESQATYLDVLNAQSNYNLAKNGVVSLKYQRLLNHLKLDYETHSLDYFLQGSAKSFVKKADK